MARASLVWAKNSENEVRAMRATASSEGQGQSGDVHGHKDGSERAVNTEGLHTAGDASGEDLERGGSDTGVEGAGTGGVHIGEHDAGDNDGKDADERLDDHGAITDLDGVPLLSRPAWRRYQKKRGCGNRRQAPQATETNRTGNIMPEAVEKPVKTGAVMVA